MVLGALASLMAVAAPKLNVIVLMVDDMGWKDVGFNGNDFVETPHIDQLAAHGLVFSQGYASGALCSPTRAAFQTGKSPATLGVNVPVTQGAKGNKPGGYPKETVPSLASFVYCHPSLKRPSMMRR